ncbi:zinc finger MYM-type protein 1 [Labeo rohita]|uniref:zinc finger MYM-type protein 1 n=1 Tax=Labeo rohita TaxID=84645 RepID=UPI0021E1F66A|nr:zinc finger MYM-type protein 1 [Labeo rohita]XP_050959757.1 zinc finger MYM-type protein 1 [Labeo rohita]
MQKITTFFKKQSDTANQEDIGGSRERSSIKDVVSEGQDPEGTHRSQSSDQIVRLREENETAEARKDKDDLGDLETGPKQVKLAQYPMSYFKFQMRAFNSKWYDSFVWLEYSVEKDAAFCYCCRLFGKQHTRINSDKLQNQGYKNWKKALSSFREHEKTAVHGASMASWQGFKSTKEYGDICMQLHSASINEIQERREYLRRIVAITGFLARQDIPFRGHSEKESSANQGNFLECFKLLSQFDPFLQNYTAASNSTYLSPVSQNEFIQSFAEEVTEEIRKEIKLSGMYAVMTDEAKDGKTEQLAVCVRYVNSDGKVVERFLGLQELKIFDAKTITNTIEALLDANDLGNLTCVAQTYDGASVMSGASGGVQALFRANHPEAIYIHCYAHELNLVLCCTCRAVQEAADFFDCLECVYTFFNTSLVNHEKLIAVQKQLGLPGHELAQLSRTRWSCQLASVTAMLENYSAVLTCLEEIGTPVAVGLRMKLCKFSVVYMMVMFECLLSITDGLHKYLQRVSLDLAEAVMYKEAVCNTLKAKRTDEMAQSLYNRAKAICQANGSDGQSSSPRRKQKRMKEFVVESTCGAVGTDLGSSDNLKRHLYFPCVDRMISELSQRFSSVGDSILKGVQACHPSSVTFLSQDLLNEVALHYNIALRAEEIYVAKHYLAKKNEECSIPDILSVYLLLDCDMFPSLKKLFQIVLTLPVSSCTCERSFSALRRLHTWLRRTMGQERLHNLAVLSIEKESVNSIEPGRVIDRFATLKSRRHTLILPPKK